MNSNAVAGPSSMPSLIPHYSSSPSPPPSSQNLPHPYPRPFTPPLLYPTPPGYPIPKQHLASTQDLLGRFDLHPAYDRCVRPFISQGDDHPTAPPSGEVNATGGNAAGPGDPGTGGGLDKGKGKEREGGAGATPGASGPGHEHDAGDGGDGEDEDAVGGKGEKKKKNTYRHLIKGVPGKHSLKKDDYLTNIMLVPPKQRMRISQFDQRIQDDAFTVTSEGIKSWNVNALVLETAQAREDRKKRKELKRLAKLQAQNGVSPINTDATALSGTTPLPLSAGAGGGGTPLATTPGGAVTVVVQPQPVQAVGRKMSVVAPARTGTVTPKVEVATPRSASAASFHPPPPPPPTVAGVGGVRSNNPSPVAATGPSIAGGGIAAGNTAAGGGGGGGVSVSGGHGGTAPAMIVRPKSAVQRPGSGLGVKGQQQQGQQQRNQTPMRTGTPVKNLNNTGTPMRVGTPMDVDQSQPRGKKRDREDGGVVVNGNGGVNGMANGGVQQQQQGTYPPPPRQGVVNVKGGTGNMRRPIKKQRMDMQGQARDVSAPVQQQPTPQGV